MFERSTSIVSYTGPGPEASSSATPVTGAVTKSEKDGTVHAKKDEVVTDKGVEKKEKRKSCSRSR